MGPTGRPARMCSSFHVLKSVCALALLGKSLGAADSLPTADASPSVNPPMNSGASTAVAPGAFDTTIFRTLFMELAEEGRHGRQLPAQTNTCRQQDGCRCACPNCNKICLIRCPGPDCPDYCALLGNSGLDCDNCCPDFGQNHRCADECSDTGFCPGEEANKCESKVGCFHESTEFVLADGVKSVSQLEIGDEIRVWNPADNAASYSPVIAWWIRPLPGSAAECERLFAAERFIRVHYRSVSGLQESSFTVTTDHNLEITCRAGETRRSDTDGPPPAQNHCLVVASSVVVGDRLAIWDDASRELHASEVFAIETIIGGSLYTPLTQLGMNFLLNGGALVPMDGKAAGFDELPDSTIPRMLYIWQGSVCKCTQPCASLCLSLL